MAKKTFLLLTIIAMLQCKNKEGNYIQNKLIERPIVDTLYNKIIEDPYRYMENVEDTVVLDWYKKQTLYAKNKISKIKNREKIIELQNSLNEKNKEETSRLKITNNNKFFYLKRNNNQDIRQLYFRDGFSGEEHFLFNPDDFKKGSVISYFAPNWNGSNVAIAITKNDVEIGDIIIFDVVNNKLNKKVIKNCWPSALGGIRWLPNNSGFTYEYIPFIDKKEKNYLLNIETRLHTLGQDITSDINLFSKNNNLEIDIKEEDFPEVSFKDEKSKYMFGSVSGASYYADYYYSAIKSIKNKKIVWKPLFKKEDLIKRFYIDGDDIIYLSAKSAKNFRICKTSLINPDFENPEILVLEDKLSVITDLTLTNRGLFFVKTKNGIEAKLYQLNSEKEIAGVSLPKKAGNINVSSKGSSYADLWIEIKGWVSEKERYVFNYDENEFVEQQIVKKNGYKELLSDVVIEELDVTSHDGVKVPLSIIYKKGVKLNGDNRVLMRGYGALGFSLKPALNSYLLHWVNEGGIYVVAHVRGGGEKGNSWHKDGSKLTKPNSWKDFIACAEYLISKNYTSPKRIAISSASAGGILIGRAITERPDLFAAAIVRVGVFNTLRSEFAPNGKNLAKDFGSIKDSLGFKGLLEMDAYYHVKKEEKYPAVYLTGGINDSRVVIWQPGKFAAKLQKANVSNNPILFNVDFEGGHGFDATKNKKNEQLADILSFALWQTEHPDYQLKK
jgi:prolyl oligopeptidase